MPSSQPAGTNVADRLQRDSRYRRIAERDGELCASCGREEKLTLDHIVPVSRGGANRIANLQILCQPCNQKKGNTLNPGDVRPERMVGWKTRAKTRDLPGGLSSRHLPECDGVFCMYGCPVLHGMGAAL